ncbi:MAG TPA: hypothetical protein VF559_06045 [Caulobacteraceae bacterium]|jgi:Flp pilus assembly protein TadB
MNRNLALLLLLALAAVLGVGLFMLTFKLALVLLLVAAVCLIPAAILAHLSFKRLRSTRATRPPVET